MQAAGKRWITYNSRQDVFKLWNIADIHLGNAGAERKHLALGSCQMCGDLTIPKCAVRQVTFLFDGGDHE